MKKIHTKQLPINEFRKKWNATKNIRFFFFCDAFLHFVPFSAHHAFAIDGGEFGDASMSPNYLHQIRIYIFVRNASIIILTFDNIILC